jgi:hypothetical protein
MNQEFRKPSSGTATPRGLADGLQGGGVRVCEKAVGSKDCKRVKVAKAFDWVFLQSSATASLCLGLAWSFASANSFPHAASNPISYQ